MAYITEKDLTQYNSMVARIERNQKKVEELNAKAIPIVLGKVKGSSKHFPFIETHMSVEMEEPKEADKIRKRIHGLEKCIKVDKEKVDAIEELYATITEPEIKTLFDMYVFEGMNWIDIAAELGEKDRTTYSKKFKNFLDNSHNSPDSHIKVV